MLPESQNISYGIDASCGYSGNVKQSVFLYSQINEGTECCYVAYNPRKFLTYTQFFKRFDTGGESCFGIVSAWVAPGLSEFLDNVRDSLKSP